MQDFEDDALSIWNSDIFGRSLSSIVREGIQAKLSLMPENARYKLKETLERIINECIWRINCDYIIRKIPLIVEDFLIFAYRIENKQLLSNILL